MTDNTIDSEQANTIKGWVTYLYHCDNPDKKAAQTIIEQYTSEIERWAAQEANKAVIKKLEDVMVKVDYKDSDTLITQKALRTHNNIQRELSRLTADKEQADA